MAAKRRLILALLPLFLLVVGCNPNVRPAPPDQLAAHAPIAFISALIVVVVDAVVIWATLKRHGN